MQVDDLVVMDDRRGMRCLLEALEPSPAARAARALLGERRRLLLCTGFPVGGLPESDGPPGTIALARALRMIGRDVVVVSWLEALEAMAQGLGDLPREEIPRGVLPPCLEGAVVTIEVCGRIQDGSYRNMNGVDVRSEAPWFEDAVGTHALISIGDGGNEFGMGSTPQSWFRGRTVERPVSTCDVLVVGQVSNWAALAVVAALSREMGRDLLPSSDEYHGLLVQLADRGIVDGVRRMAVPTEDGTSFGRGADIVRDVRGWFLHSTGG